MNHVTFEGVDLELEEVPCRVCGCADRRPLANRMRHNLNLSTVICESCGLAYTSPRFTEAAAATFYEHLYPAFHGRRDGVTDEWVRKSARSGRQRFEMLSKFLPPDEEATVVEIGSGAGGFLTAATGTSWHPIGVEPGQQQADYSRSRGLDVRHRAFEQVDLASIAPRAIVAFHVFEHLNDPIDFLRRVRAALPDNGLVYLEVPDLAHADTKLSEFFQAPHHYSFTAQTLRSALQVGGFRVLYTSEKVGNLSMVATVGEAHEAERYDVDSFVHRLMHRDRLLKVADYVPQISKLTQVRGMLRSV